MDAIQKSLLEQVAGLHEVPEGAYNIRANGKAAARNTTASIDIVSKEDKDGIDIIIKPGTKNQSVHIPVVLSESGLTETVYNDFLIGDDCDVTIVAGCGIHNCGVQNSEHSGIHTFHVGKRSKVRYVERHYGEGDGRGENIMNPTTVVEMDEDSYMEMETTQIKGVDSTVRTTRAKAGPQLHPDHQGEGDDPRQAAGQVRLYCGPERRGLPHQRDLPLCGPGPVPPGVPGPDQRQCQVLRPLRV